MNKQIKAFTLVACAIILVIGSVAGTLAYLSDQTETVKNTFTVGKVKITLDEAKVDSDGTPVCPQERVTANTYHLMPNMIYTKDPTIHFAKDSVASWVFIEVKNDIEAVEEPGADSIAQQILANGWIKLDAPTAGVMTAGSTLYYREVAANTTAEAVDLPIFDHFKVRADVPNFDAFDGSQLVTVTGYAIQKSESYATGDEAWSMLVGQVLP